MLTVAVGLSPRIGSVKWVRRGATIESAAFFKRRSATNPKIGTFLKPTATIMVSLRDRDANRPARPVFCAETIVMRWRFIGTRVAAGPADASAFDTADSHQEETFHQINEPRKMRNTRTGTMINA